MAKYLDLLGLSDVWDKIKEFVSYKLDEFYSDVKGTPNHLATLDAGGKLPTSQLPTLKSVGGTSIVGSGNIGFKTINGNSIVGDGNITLDLNIYSVVEALPTEDAINPNKIYLLLTSGGGAQGNLYTEYAYVDNKWEEFGKYKADVDLTNYVKFTDVATDSKNGVMTPTQKKYIDAIITNGTQILQLTDCTSTSVTVDIEYDAYDGNNVLTGESITIPIANTTNAGAITAATFNKINGIANGATADIALSEQEILNVLV